MVTFRTVSHSFIMIAALSSSAMDALAADPAETTVAAPAATTDAPSEPAPTEAVAAAPAQSAEPVAPAAASPAGVPPPVTDKGADASAAAKKGPLDGMRFEIGGRVGYAISAGEAMAGSKLSDYVSGAIPLLVDASLRLKSGLGLGLYGGFGFGIGGSALDGCSDCSANTLRFGILLSQHFAYGGTIDPWIGAGVGADYLIVSSRFQSNGVDYHVSNTYTAVPDLSLHAGLDIGGDSVAFGPFASVSYSQYGSVSTDITCESLGCDGSSLNLATGSIDSDRRSGHTWLMFGLRGTYLK